MAVPLLSQPVLVIDFCDLDWVYDDHGRRVGSSYRWGDDAGGLGLRELDERPAMLVHPRELSPSEGFSAYGRHAVRDGANRLLGYATSLGGERPDGSSLARAERPWSARSAIVAADGRKIADASRLSRVPGRSSNVWTRFLSPRYRFAFTPAHADLRPFAIGAIFLAHITRLDD